MTLVIFGLSVSSSGCNVDETLSQALARRGDLRQLHGGTPRPYAARESVREASKPAKLVQGGESGSERRWLWISGGHPAW
jgi:hypothetical protein